MFCLRKTSDEKVILLAHVTNVNFPQENSFAKKIHLLAELVMDSESEWLFMAPRWPSQHWWEELCHWWLAHLGTGKSCGTKEDFIDHKVFCINDGKVEGETGSALLPSKQNCNFLILKCLPDLAVRGKLVWSPRPWPCWAFGDRRHEKHQDDVTDVWWEGKSGS